MDYEGKGLKAQMRRADKLAARFVVIVGEQELAAGTWKVRDMSASAQEEVAEGGIVDSLMSRLRG
jgi:histidyl-tRNA synthetase